MKIKTELEQLTSGIIIALVLFSMSLLPSFFNNILPKYYGGDPDYSIENHEKLKRESTERFRQRFPEFSEKDVLFELPPKLIDRRIQTIIYVLGVPFQIIWGLYWSIYAYIKRKSFRSKNIVWISYGIYLILLFVHFLLIGLAMENF